MISARYFCFILTKLAISPRVFLKTPIWDFMEIRPAGPRWYADRRTDRHNEAIGASRDYANAPNRNPSNGLRTDTNSNATN